MDINKYRYVAHRGIFDNINNFPENSLLAFKEAIRDGYAIEFDVRLTLDEKIIVFHDLNLKRLTGVNKDVDNCTLSEINKLKLLSTNQSIPTLEEVLDLINGSVPIVIEIKNEKSIGTLEKLLMERLKHYKGEYIIESFNPLSIFWIKKHYSNVNVGQLLSGDGHLFKDYIARILDIFIKPEFIAYDINFLSEEHKKFCKEKNIYLFAWTIKTEEELEKAITLSDAIIFENTVKIIK